MRVLVSKNSAPANDLVRQTADEAIVNETFARDFGFAKPADAIGKTIEFLAAPKESPKQAT